MIPALRIAGMILMGLGTLFSFAMTVGMLRFPDAYTRLHASTKCLTAGGTLVFIGIAILKPEIGFLSRLILLIVFFSMSSPVANHAIAHAMYKQGIAKPTVIIDEYASYAAVAFSKEADESDSTPTINL